MAIIVYIYFFNSCYENNYCTIHNVFRTRLIASCLDANKEFGILGPAKWFNETSEHVGLHIVSIMTVYAAMHLPGYVTREVCNRSLSDAQSV